MGEGKEGDLGLGGGGGGGGGKREEEEDVPSLLGGWEGSSSAIRSWPMESISIWIELVGG